MIELLLAAIAVAPAPPVFEEMSRGVRAKLRVDVPCAAAYKVLADHEAYPEFMPSVRATRTVRKGAGWADVEFVYQRGEGAVQHRTYRPNESIRWTLMEGETDQIKTMSGFWGFTSVDAGGGAGPSAGAGSAASAGSCQVLYELLVETKLPVPGSIVAKFMKPVVERTVEAVGHRIASGGTWKKPQK